MADDAAAAEALPLRMRQAVRAIIVTPASEVLLVRFEFPTATRWALPGGGLEPGETHHDALRRELAEELGLVDVAIGPHVWNREHVIPFLDGKWDGQHEQIHLVFVPARFEPLPQLSWDQLHAEYVHELRWWQIAGIDDALEGAENADIAFVPRRLPALLRALLRDGPPENPIDSGV